MKRLFGIMACALVASAASAQLQMAQFSSVSAWTGATSVASASNTTELTYNGYVDTVILDLAGTASPTVDVDLVTYASGGTGPERTIYSADNVVADFALPIRVPAYDTTGTIISNTVERIPLVGDKLVLKVYDANKTGIVAKAYVVILK